MKSPEVYLNIKSPIEIYNQYKLRKKYKLENRIYDKISINETEIEKIFEDSDLVRYYNYSMKVFALYCKVLSQFIKSDIKFVERKSIYDSPNRAVFKKLLEISHQQYNDNHSDNLLLKNDFIKKFGKTDEYCGDDYSTKYYNLYKKIQNIVLCDNMKDDIKRINDDIIKFSASSNYKDKISYYLTIKDENIFLLFSSWVIAIHAAAILILVPLFPFIVGPFSAASISSIGLILSPTGGSIVNNLSFLSKRIFYILLRTKNIYIYDNDKINNKFDKINSIYKNLSEVKDIVSQIDKMNSKINDFNYYFANCFQYYCELKEISDKYSDPIFNEYFLSNKDYDKIKNEVNDKYLKTVSYFRYKKLLQGSLKIQIENMKELNLKSIYLLRNNSSFIEFINKNSENIDRVINKVCDKLFEKYHEDMRLKKSFKDYILKSLNTHNNDSKAKNAMNDINSVKEKTFFDEARLTLDYLRIVPVTVNLGKQIYGGKLDIKDQGLWFVISVLEVTMLVTGSIDVFKNYEKCYSILKNISAGYSGSNFAFSSFSIVTDSWLHLFNNSFLTNMYSNPFSFILSLAEFRMLSAVKSNHLKIWDEIYNEYIKFKLDAERKGNLYPSFNYFIKSRRISPIEAICNLGDIFTEKFCDVSKFLTKINADSEKLFQKLESIRNRKDKAFSARGDHINDVFEILLIYSKVLLRSLAISKDIQILEHYVKIVYGFDLEIDRTLKNNFLLQLLNDASVFGVVSFASNIAEDL